MKKILNFILIGVMLIGNTYLLIRDISSNDFSRVATYFALYPLLFVPNVIQKFIRTSVSSEVTLVYYIFIFLAQFLGSGVNLYKQINWFDTFTHFISGTLSCFVALILLSLFRIDFNRKYAFHVTYILGIVFLIAGGWEFFEFGMDQLTGSNLQHAIETGVEDTMCDMLAAFYGSIIFLIIYLYEMLGKHNGFITKFIKSL